MPERRRRDLLTPLLLALAVILLLAFWVFQPFLLVFAVAACVALLLAPGPEALRGGARGPAHARRRAPRARDHGRHPRARADVALPARAPGRALPGVDPRAAAPRARRSCSASGSSCPSATRACAPGSPGCRPRSRPLVSGGIEQLAGRANVLLQNVLGRVTHAAVDLGPLPADAVLPAARRRAAPGRAAPDLALLGGAGAPDLRPPRADHQGRAAGGGGGAGGAGHPRRDRLHDVRRAVAVRVGDRRHPRRHRAPRRLAARLAARLRLPASCRAGPAPRWGCSSSAS